MAKINRKKGKSLIRFPESYVVIDIETTGLSPLCDEIIEISAIKVENNSIIETFSFLIKPKCNSLSYFITKLTGITNKMLASAPSISEILPQFSEFIGDSILIGHNVNFDINFLYDEFQKILKTKLNNDFVDTMQIARRLYPELAHHKLKDVAEKHGVCTKGAHRGLKDCEITQAVFVKMREDVIQKFQDINKFC